ncbi:hypothetical protein BKA57DRAFT_464524 [Linnemannia elongata]|nr:hypothetical protein BKA57DRAFT_464524 [Linnemannia elongata]
MSTALTLTLHITTTTTSTITTTPCRCQPTLTSFSSIPYLHHKQPRLSFLLNTQQSVTKDDLLFRGKSIRQEDKLQEKKGS